MASSPRVVLVTDTSVLINFLRLDRMELFHDASIRFLVTEHAEKEVAEIYPEQRARYEFALQTRYIERCTVTDVEALELFSQLLNTARLGAGESATIAYALSTGAGLAIDDRRASNEARRMSSTLRIMTTADLVVTFIREGLLSVDQADAMKFDWAENHRFRLKIVTFADLL